MDERFQEILDSTPDAIVVVDGAGRIEVVNRQAEKLFGYARNELLGQAVELLLPGLFRVQHAGERNAYSGHPPVRPPGGEVLNARRKDGGETPVDISLTPLESPEGLIVTCAIRDDSGRKRAENRFRALLESAPDAMVIVNSSGVIELVNSQTEELFGYARAEMLQQPVEMLLPERFREKHVGQRDRYFSDPTPRPMSAGLELSALDQDGTEFPVEISLSPLTTDEGILVTAAIRDISDRKRTEQEILQLNLELEQRVAQRTAELAELNRELKERNEENKMFIYSASHDLRSPLLNLQGFAEELKLATGKLQSLIHESPIPQAVQREIGRLEADMHEAIEFIQTAVTRLRRLVDALLRLSRAGRVEYQRQDVDADQVVRDVLMAQAARIAEKGCEVVKHDLPHVLGDATALEQVFDNLIGNALNYLDDSRKSLIEIGICNQKPLRDRPLQQPSHVFYVRDNGLGISAGCQRRIFNPFQRFHPQMSKGEGLGLVLVKRIIERHGGSIWFDSVEGEGSTFFVALPAETELHHHEQV